jgi:hypothetical protein
MVALTTPVEILPADPGRDYQTTYRLDGEVHHLSVMAASYYEVWLIVKRIHPTASVVAILMVSIQSI